MKILYYLPSLYMSGGLERIITFKANYLASKLGHEVVVMTSEQMDKRPYFPLAANVKHIDIDVPFDIGGPGSKIIKILTYPFRYRKFKNRFTDVLYKERPDVTVSTLRREINFLTSLEDGSIKIGEFHITRGAYFTESVTYKSYLKGFLKRFLEQRFIKKLSRLDKLVLLTNEEKSFWPELSNTMVIYNPVTITPTVTSDCKSNIVMAAGRYSYQKGFDMLIKAWNMVVKECPGWELRIYGEGNDMELKQLIEKHELEQSCFLLPPVSNIEEKYAESSIFVLSSRYEGFGMVLCEAMTCGVPAVSFDCKCGPKDIINHGKDGLLAECCNIDALAQSVIVLAKDQVKREQMGRDALVNSKRFSQANIMGIWNDLFNYLIKSNG
ncbi:Glycosyltransferase Gtf1 [bioreactor metagenome]|jgi:glycosyltransferase involved in cell wall biosynthesis|uniref:Glycosyltransferase Gtf1 n=1 Tax=bioreactor metagenome TaxID=1076179 RepID=A0A644X3T9_9ZZZZ|nr:glycosyltransferase family 4 protein [Rikenellaceae bacterium]